MFVFWVVIELTTRQDYNKSITAVTNVEGFESEYEAKQYIQGKKEEQWKELIEHTKTKAMNESYNPELKHRTYEMHGVSF